MLSYIENKEKRTGLIGTIVFHVILLLIFIFFGLSYMHPPEELGMMVDFGNSEQGMGVVENENPTAETQQEETPAVQTPSNPVVTEQDVTTQEIEETVTVQKKEEKKEVKKTETTVEQKVQTPSNKLLEAMNKNNSTEASQASSEGNTSGVGNTGKQHGTEGAPDGGTRGATLLLDGRSWVKKPKFENNSQEFGTVVVAITVDKYGNVTKATGGAKGSTTTSAYLTKLAEEDAYKAKFSANPDAAEEQFGTITIRFTPR